MGEGEGDAEGNQFTNQINQSRGDNQLSKRFELWINSRVADSNA